MSDGGGDFTLLESITGLNGSKHLQTFHFHTLLNQISGIFAHNLDQGFSNYGSRPHLGSHDLVLGSRNILKTNWLYSSELKVFVTLTRKLKVDLK